MCISFYLLWLVKVSISLFCSIETKSMSMRKMGLSKSLPRLLYTTKEDKNSTRSFKKCVSKTVKKRRNKKGRKCLNSTTKVMMQFRIGKKRNKRVGEIRFKESKVTFCSCFWVSKATNSSSLRNSKA